VVSTKFIHKVVVCVQLKRDVQRNSTRFLALLHLVCVSRNFQFVSTRELFQRQTFVLARDGLSNEFALVQLVLVRRFLLATSMLHMQANPLVSALVDFHSCFAKGQRLERNLASAVLLMKSALQIRKSFLETASVSSVTTHGLALERVHLADVFANQREHAQSVNA